MTDKPTKKKRANKKESPATKKRPATKKETKPDTTSAKRRNDFKNQELRSNLYDTLLLTMGNISRACKLLDIQLPSLYYALDHDSEFKAEFTKVREHAITRAEDELIRRAVEGVEKGVWYQGELCGTEVVYSDSLLSKLIAAYNTKYRTNALEVTGRDGGPMESVVVIELPNNGREDKGGSE